MRGCADGRPTNDACHTRQEAIRYDLGCALVFACQEAEVRQRYSHDLVSLPALVTPTADRAPILEDVEFRACTLLGPAILYFMDGVDLEQCNLGGEADAILWPITGGRVALSGVIGCRRVRFEKCEFRHVGFAGDEAFIGRLVSSVGDSKAP